MSRLTAPVSGGVTRVCSVAMLLMLAAGCTVAAHAQAASPQSAPLPQGQNSAPGAPKNPAMVITLDQALELAREHNPALQAQRTLVFQNKEQEVTANLRPNPQLSWDVQYLPLFTPSLLVDKLPGEHHSVRRWCRLPV